MRQHHDIELRLLSSGGMETKGWTDMDLMASAAVHDQSIENADCRANADCGCVRRRRSRSPAVCPPTGWAWSAPCWRPSLSTRSAALLTSAATWTAPCSTPPTRLLRYPTLPCILHMHLLNATNSPAQLHCTLHYQVHNGQKRPVPCSDHTATTFYPVHALYIAPLLLMTYPEITS